LDMQLSAGSAPGVRAVAGAIVGDDAFDGDSAGTKPAHGSDQHPNGGISCFVVMDFGVGHPGVIVDDGVHEPVPEVGVALATAFDARGGAPVVCALGASDESGRVSLTV